MKLKKYKLGELIELVEETNSQGKYGPKDVRGMTITKEIIPTKADVASADLRKFLVVHPDEFVFNPRTHGKKIGFGYNNTKVCFLISWNNIAFRVKSDAINIVIPTYLFLHFNRKEWDREACFCSWGSSTEVFSWNAICDMKLTLPSIEQQRKYVNIYLALQNNLATYQSKVEDLKMVCDGYIEELRRKFGAEPIGPYIRSIDVRNTNLSVTLTQGVDVNMQFITAKREAEDQEGTKIVRTGQFAFNKVVKSNGTKLPIALREGPDCVISSSYEVFEVVDKEKLLPEYLMLWLSRSETHRQCGYKSYGTTRDVFPFEDLCKLQFPIPNIETQNNIANIYKCYIERQRIAEALKEQIKNICPVLIRGSLT
ncbi:MAG: restriction endonuclease subunit S [Paludibacteraceae bacterium]|nr:restriction endonuclease subunit S [Paludibacteraceae bacterium]